jgi:hypothetical protein
VTRQAALGDQRCKIGYMPPLCLLDGTATEIVDLTPPNDSKPVMLPCGFAVLSPGVDPQNGGARLTKLGRFSTPPSNHIMGH